MLKPVNPKARTCYERAAKAREYALHARSGAERDDFLAIEKSWLKLAESYEFGERLGRFIGKDFPKHPVCPSCGVPMWLVQMISSPAAVECRYQCKACDLTILLRDGDPVD